jgi:hypothetical protein
MAKAKKASTRNIELDVEVSAGLTAREIIGLLSPLHTTHGHESKIANLPTKFITRDLQAVNARTGHSARLVRYKSGAEDQEAIICEIDFGKSFITSAWIWNLVEEGPGATERFEKEADNAFILMSALIGKKVTYGLIVE